MQNFQQNLAKLEAADTQVLGISMDSSFSNKAWAQQINVTFPLLSDWGGDVTKQYGVYNPKYKAARRVNYLIDKNGKVVNVWIDPKLHFPVKAVTQDATILLTNIQEGQPDASLFQIPPDFHKMDMSGMMPPGVGGPPQN